MLGRNDRKDLLMSNRSRARHQACLHLSSVDRMGFRRLGEIHLQEALDLVLLKVTQARMLVVVKKCPQKHHHSVDVHSWSLSHRLCRSGVSLALKTR